VTSSYPDSPGFGPGRPGSYPDPGYSTGTPPGQQRGAGMATAALVLGIVALVLCWTVIGGVVLGLLAVIFGAIALRRASRGEAEGRGRALAGLITGALGIVAAVALVAIGVSFLNSPSGKNLVNCVQQANGDQAAVQQCQQQYTGQTTK
jgi:hypothetical protein